jgi:hypothetical protein
MSLGRFMLALAVGALLLGTLGCSSGNDVSESDALSKYDQINKATAESAGKDAPKKSDRE